jgi:molybdopterin synthase catalytic subunit
MRWPACRPWEEASVPQKRFEITRNPLSVDDIVARLVHPAVGGVTAFVGVVRGETDGRQTQHLAYEAYPDMAEKQLRQIGDEIRQRWPTVREVAIVHRIGRLEIGETIVVIAVSSPHRYETFDATHYAIDRLKEIVPIWKKEVWTDGEAWRTEQESGGEKEQKSEGAEEQA